ncbi:hypothetical protein V502_10325 [Pseudogymnoascus sp. VKM F-4520 (FW-2644)]|nr:hypothetical protein V502_10325 [Pseudogymnoascus sp. VKM F-4520 (FW-2644)]
MQKSLRSQQSPLNTKGSKTQHHSTLVANNGSNLIVEPLVREVLIEVYYLLGPPPPPSQILERSLLDELGAIHLCHRCIRRSKWLSRKLTPILMTKVNESLGPVEALMSDFEDPDCSLCQEIITRVEKSILLSGIIPHSDWRGRFKLTPLPPTYSSLFGIDIVEYLNDEQNLSAHYFPTPLNEFHLIHQDRILHGSELRVRRGPLRSNNGTVSLPFYAMKGASAADRHIRRPLNADYGHCPWREPFRKCLEAHSRCTISFMGTRIENEFTQGVSMPRRLIEVAPKSEVDDTVRLVELPQDMLGSYTILSHCWGGGQPIQTKIENLKQHYEGIGLHQLPPTFRDAVNITRDLGIKYVWIDTMCIIQDDRRDWDQEAKKMGSYYHYASLVIAATGASDANCGLFAPRQLFQQKNDTPGLQLPSFNDEGHLDGWFVLAPESSLSQCNPYKSKLSTRGWVLQEWILARRIAFFTPSQLVWKCHETKLLEAMDLDQTLAPILYRPLTLNDGHVEEAEIMDWQDECIELDWSDLENLKGKWVQIVCDYNRRFLTVEADKVIALSGIVECIGQKWNLTCSFGHWENWNFIETLAWITVNVRERLQRNQYVPSWSWLSIPGDVTCHSNIHKMYRRTRISGVRDFTVSEHRLKLRTAVFLLESLLPHDASASELETHDTSSDGSSSESSGDYFKPFYMLAAYEATKSPFKHFGFYLTTREKSSVGDDSSSESSEASPVSGTQDSQCLAGEEEKSSAYPTIDRNPENNPEIKSHHADRWFDIRWGNLRVLRGFWQSNHGVVLDSHQNPNPALFALTAVIKRNMIQKSHIGTGFGQHEPHPNLCDLTTGFQEAFSDPDCLMEGILLYPNEKEPGTWLRAGVARLGPESVFAKAYNSPEQFRTSAAKQLQRLLRVEDLIIC